VRQKINWLWRLCATGIAFAYIFVGGGVLAMVLLPVLALIPGHQRDRAQTIIRMCFRLYITMLQRLGLLTLDIAGAERLQSRTGRLIVANHPSILDVVILMALIPRVQCIVKHQLWNSFLLGGLMRRAGYIRNDLEADVFVEACRTSIDQGYSLIIFPEGTRTLPGALPQFKRGFANLAMATKAGIQLVFITCDPPTLIKGEPWWRIPPRKPHFRVVVDECLDMAAYPGYRSRSIEVRRLVADVQAHYARRLGEMMTVS
jgi:1-acyl-sn-glycerol-3-phosphate acyltransferase